MAVSQRALRGMLSLAMIAAQAGSAFAETARVRSGEHPGFTRLVIELAEPTNWRLGRVDGGYAIDFRRDGVILDTSEVYRLINRERIASVTQDNVTGRATIALGCSDCHATATTFRDSWIILDVTAGTAPPGSAFEDPLDPEPDRTAPADETGSAETRPGSPASGASSKTISVPARPRSGPDSAANSQALDADTAEVSEPIVPPSAPVGSAASWTSSITLDPSDSQLANALKPAFARGSAADIDRGDPASSPGGASVQTNRIAEQQAWLLEELARAAAQGLLEANLPALDRIRPPEGTDHAATTEPPAEATVPTPAPAVEDHVRLQAETSIDRDTGVQRVGRGATPEGRACLGDQLFAIDAWGEAGDPATGLTDRRMALVGEFDRPDTEAVLKLARYYLYLGFGAEAKSTVAAFGTAIPEAEAIVALASILDGEQEGLPGILGGQIDCLGRVALWSTLAQGGPHPGDTPNTAALLAAFSALPPHLRRHLGPTLAEGFLANGDSATAIALRNAITRAAGDPGAGVELLDMEIARAEGDPTATATLPALAGENDEVAARAYATYLETELAAGRVPEDGAGTASALAFEIAKTDEGVALARLAARSILATGEFDAARREILRLEADGTTYDPELWAEFATALAGGAQDAEFLRQVFATRDIIARATLPEPAVTALALRLTALGFGEEALRYLPASSENEAVLIARAGALLATDSPSAAFGAVSGLRGPAAERLRARAMLVLGDPRRAAERFRQAGDTGLSDRAAWIAGAWDLLADSEDLTLQRIAAARSRSGEQTDVGTGSAEPGAAETTGRVAQAQSALAAAEAARVLLGDVLARGGG